MSRGTSTQQNAILSLLLSNGERMTAYDIALLLSDEEWKPAAMRQSAVWRSLRSLWRRGLVVRCPEKTYEAAP